MLFIEALVAMYVLTFSLNALSLSFARPTKSLGINFVLCIIGIYGAVVMLSVAVGITGLAYGLGLFLGATGGFTTWEYVLKRVVAKNVREDKALKAKKR